MDNVTKEIKDLLRQINDSVAKRDLRSVEILYNKVRDIAILKKVNSPELVLEIQETYKRISMLVESLKPKSKTDLMKNAPGFALSNSQSNVQNLQNTSGNFGKVSLGSSKISSVPNRAAPNSAVPNNSGFVESISKNVPKSDGKSDDEYDSEKISPEEFEAIEKEEAKKAGKKYRQDETFGLVNKEKEVEQLYDFKSVSKKIAELSDRLNELMITTEKNDGKWERQNSVNDGMNNTIMLLKEDIGSFRSTILIRERAADKMEKTFERLKDMVDAINPDKLSKRFEKMDTSIETLSAKVEKQDMQVTKTLHDVSDYKEIMSRIKSYENLFNVLNQIKDGINQMQKVKIDADRIASKMEVMFSEVNRKLRVIDSVEQKMSSFESLLKDTLKNVDLFEAKLKDTVKESSLNEFVSDLNLFKGQVANFNEKVNDFGLDLMNTQKNITKIDDALHVINDTMLTTESKQFKLNLETQSKISKQILDDVIEFQNNKLKNLLSKFETEINLSKRDDAKATYENVKELLIKLAPVSKLNVVEQTKKARELIDKYNNMIKSSLSQLDKKSN